MKVKVLGVQPVDYAKKGTGEQVKGITIHSTFKDVNVMGDAVSTDFINSKLEIPGVSEVKPGMMVNIEYNRRGYVCGLDVCR